VTDFSGYAKYMYVHHCFCYKIDSNLKHSQTIRYFRHFRYYRILAIVALYIYVCTSMYVYINKYICQVAQEFHLSFCFGYCVFRAFPHFLLRFHVR